MASTATAPLDSIDVSRNSVTYPGRAHGATCKFGLLMKPNIGSYGNGYEPTGAAYGSNNVTESEVWQAEIKEIHPRSNTINDKSTVLTAGDDMPVKRHEVNKSYWLPCSALTAARGQLLITSTTGTVILQTAHTATPLPHHCWTPVIAASAASWVKARYLGFKTSFTT